LISAGKDGVLRLWDLHALAREPGRFVPEGDAVPVSAVAISADSKRILSGHGNGKVRLWMVKTRREVLPFSPGSNAPVACVVFAPEGKGALVGGGPDNDFWLVDLKTGDKIRAFQGHTAAVRRIALAADGRRIVSTAADKTIQIWDIRNPKPLRRLEWTTADVQDLALSPDGHQAFLAGPDNLVRALDLKTGKASGEFAGHSAPVKGVAVCPHSHRIVSASEDHTVRLWDSRTHQ